MIFRYQIIPKYSAVILFLDHIIQYSIIYVNKRFRVHFIKINIKI